MSIIGTAYRMWNTLKREDLARRGDLEKWKAFTHKKGPEAFPEKAEVQRQIAYITWMEAHDPKKVQKQVEIYRLNDLFRRQFVPEIMCEERSRMWQSLGHQYQQFPFLNGANKHS